MMANVVVREPLVVLLVVTITSIFMIEVVTSFQLARYDHNHASTMVNMPTSPHKRVIRPNCCNHHYIRPNFVTSSIPSRIVRSNSHNSDNDSSNNMSNNNNNNFLQDIFQSAFANDRELLSQSNKRVGMLDEGISNGDDDGFIVVPKQSNVPELTPTQQAWRQKMLSPTQQQVQTTDLIDSTIRIDLYLSGIPNKDPSNDLYASKTNISLRDRSVGQVLPTQPTIASVGVSFLPNNKCAVTTIMISTEETSSGDDNDDSDTNDSTLPSSPSDSGGRSFVNTDITGDWKLSEDGKQIRFRISVYGFQRTIQTKGTIQKIYWSNEKETITETSTLYSIPEGWLYFETELMKRSNGSVQWMTNNNNNNKSIIGNQGMKNATPSSSSSNGIIKVEQTTGFLGIATRMVPCGKFVVTAS